MSEIPVPCDDGCCCWEPVGDGYLYCPICETEVVAEEIGCDAEGNEL